MIHLLHIHALLGIRLQVQLDELEPLFEPQPIPFSFSTPAWFVLGGVLIIIVSYVIFLQLQKYRKNRYRRDALRILNSLNVSKSMDSTAVINKIRIILKQNAIHRYGRLTVASLYGKEWLEFLESKGKNTSFSQHQVLHFSRRCRFFQLRLTHGYSQR